jgi:hypothetical protein
VAGELVEVAVEGQPAWLRREDAATLAETPAAGPNVRLLPRYDVYLLGYQNRNGVVPELYQSRVNAGGGIVHPIVLVDGRVVGTWSAIQQRRQVVINIAPFTALAPLVEERLMAEVVDLGRFLGMAATGHVAAPRS